jgi:hypothetical protein
VEDIMSELEFPVIEGIGRQIVDSQTNKIIEDVLLPPTYISNVLKAKLSDPPTETRF